MSMRKPSRSAESLAGRNRAAMRASTEFLKILEANASSITIEHLARIHVYVSTGSREPDDARRHAGSIEQEWGNGRGTLSKANITRDIAVLKSDTELVTTWATEHVAHLSLQPPPDGLKIGDFDKAIADVVAVYRKYGILLTATD